MIQFNLLPDIKTDFIRARRMKRLLYLAAVVAAGISALLIVLTFSMTAVQKNHISNLDGDISNLEDELNSIEDLSRVLTVQNQLNTLPELYEGRPAVERLPGYLDQVTPAEANTGITRLEIDFSESTLVIEGVSDNLEVVNKFADALKFTGFSYIDENSGEEFEDKAFSEVVYSDFSRDKDVAEFSISMSFDPVIFDETKKIKLTVPAQITTRSELQRPLSDLFIENSEEE